MEQDQTLNQLLVEMDGFAGADGIVVLGATNRVDVLDPALTRSGRFDRRVNVPWPDVKGRLEILKVHVKNSATGSGRRADGYCQVHPGTGGGGSGQHRQ